MRCIRLGKGALLKGAPFSLPGAFLLFSAGLLAAPAPTCAPDSIDETARVEYVYDGDTVRLADGRKVRFIGINTPEIAHKEKAGEPLGTEARLLLEKLLGSERRIALRYDEERHDRHGRTLAHVFLPDRSSIAAALLREGLGMHLAVPPNLWASDCYQEVERQARRATKGLWRLEHYRPLPARTLKRSDQGYRLVQGTVVGKGESRKSLWLDLDGPAAVRIPKKDLQHFTEDPAKLVGREITVRGWYRWHQGKLRTTVRHPSALEKVAPSEATH